MFKPGDKLKLIKLPNGSGSVLCSDGNTYVHILGDTYTVVFNPVGSGNYACNDNDTKKRLRISNRALWYDYFELLEESPISVVQDKAIIKPISLEKQCICDGRTLLHFGCKCGAVIAKKWGLSG